MKTVELFSGIGGFRLAAEGCGHTTVWANDVAPLACRVYADRFGKGQIREGDIAELMSEIPRHQLLSAGFPCQPFSSAGKKQGIEDPRGTLFSHIVEILGKHQPKFFVLENVKRLLTMDRGVHFATILASLAELDYRIEWRLLNAAHFGLPQNRRRVFIVGARTTSSNGADFSRRDRLDVRLATAADFSACRNFELRHIERPDRWRDVAKHGVKFPNWGIAYKGRFYAVHLPVFHEGLSPVTLDSVLQGEDEVDEQFDFTESTIERLARSERVDRFVQGVEILSNQGGGARMGYTVFGTRGLAPTLTATPSRHYERYKIGRRYRRLSNVEYARIQGFPDDHCTIASIYSQYSLYGNAVPPPMAEWVMRRLESAGVPIGDVDVRPRQQELFVNA